MENLLTHILKIKGLTTYQILKLIGFLKFCHKKI